MTAFNPNPTSWSTEQINDSLNLALQNWDKQADLWLFSYGSLIWQPEFQSAEEHLATVKGYHRALCLWSYEFRGTPTYPGLVFGLDRGGICQGLVSKIPAASVIEVFTKLWQREMGQGSYLPKWVKCHLPDEQTVLAIAFVMDRKNEQYAGNLSDADKQVIVQNAKGKRGACQEYVMETIKALRAHGIVDRGLERFASQLNPHLNHTGVPHVTRRHS